MKLNLERELNLQLRLNPKRLVLLLLVLLILSSSVIPVTYISNNYYDSYFGIWVNHDDKLDFNESVAFSKRFYQIGKKIEASGWRPAANDIRIRNWALEITPMFQYEGLVSETKINFKPLAYNFSSGFEHNHIAGRSDCIDYVAVNARFSNPISGWYRSQDWPVVLAHEIAHAQQGEKWCGFPKAEIERVEELTAILNDSSISESDRTKAKAERKAITDYWAEDKELLENTAQIMAWETMAALANQGSHIAALALAYEFRGLSLNATAAIASAQGREDDYEQLLQNLYREQPDTLARIAKNRRFWADRPEDLAAIRLKYSWEPLDLVFTHRRSENIPDLALDNGTRWLEIDDLIYFLGHAEELVDWALIEVKKD